MKTNLLMSTFPGGLPGVKIFPNHQYSLYSLLNVDINYKVFVFRKNLVIWSGGTKSQGTV